MAMTAAADDNHVVMRPRFGRTPLPLPFGMAIETAATSGKKVIEAIDVVFKDYRTERGIKLKQ